MTSSVPAQPGLPAIQMAGVAFGAMRAPERMVAEGINWTVNAGDYWVVAGLHGSGKSDFLMLAAGLMPPRHGEYRCFGERMPIFQEARLPHRLRVGLVFESGQLLNHLTVAENVALPLRYHRNLGPAEAAAPVAELLGALELTPWADAIPGTLGRSWQRRAGLARALALKPDLLLLDNPLAGLDPRHAHWWLEFLDLLARGHPLTGGRPATLVVATADFRPWKDHATQFAILRNHRFLPLGSWQQLQAAADAPLRELLTEPTQTG